MDNNEMEYTPKSNATFGEHIVGFGKAEDIAPQVKAIGEEQIKKASDILLQYKRGKTNLDNKIIDNEQWWKLRHWETLRDKNSQFTPATAWLWNTIVSKHADLEDGYPEPALLPREESDKQEAQMLESIIPVILEQNGFHKTYDACCWDKLKHGTGIYGVFWDASRHNSLGDISVKKISPLSLYWESGITDIQDSQNVFHVELVDNDVLKRRYPQLDGKVLSQDFYVSKFLYDDQVDTTNKSTVVDWYYKKEIGGKQTLQYVKYVGDTVLYATENETIPPTSPIIDHTTGMQAINPATGNALSQPVGKALSETGLYDHARYPFVFDVLFPIEGTPFGYGYTDTHKDTQVSVDELNRSIVKNALISATPRFFKADNCEVNMEDFTNWEKEIISTSGKPTDENLRQFSANPLPSYVIDALNFQIEMMKETSGNRDVTNGGTTGSVTSASGIIALQEASSKTSRNIISTTYDAYKEVVKLVVELIRQFYDLPRQFRIVGERGAQEFITYSNVNIKPQEQGYDFGIDMGYRVPEFDINITASKHSAFSKQAQNELQLQLLQLGFFNPSNSTQALACLEGMDFETKDDVVRTIERNGTIIQLFNQLLQFSINFASQYDQSVIPALQQMGMQAGVMDATQIPQQSGKVNVPTTDSNGNVKSEEHPVVSKARERVQNATQPRS